MQNKGLVRFFVACLVLVCAYYLSFSFVTRIYDGKANDYGLTTPTYICIDDIVVEK